MHDKKINAFLFDEIVGTRDAINSDIPYVSKKKEKKYNEEVVRIKELVEVSYLLATNSMKIQKYLSKKGSKALSSGKDLRLIVKHLGVAILEYYKEEDDKLPIMFKAFCYARPLLNSKYKNIEEDFPLMVGVYTLTYTNFILNSKTVKNQYIKKMILG